MTKRAARFSLADVNRAARAAREQGAAAVEILPDGTIRLILKDEAKCEAKADTKPIRDFKL